MNLLNLKRKKHVAAIYMHFSKMLLATVTLSIFVTTPITALAVDYEAEMEARKLLPIESNEIPNWPTGPEIGAKSAILMEMNTHTILYAKNIHEQMYPASTTKILTCLLAAQHCNMDELVTFSHDAVYDVPSDGSNMGMDAGEIITMEQAMYGVLVGSANEAASAVGEHVAAKLGKNATTEAFAEIMNAKANELGCLHTNFVNANGLFDENHYTTAYDLALIGSEFFQNELLSKMASTSRYNIPPTATQPDDIWITSKNRLLQGKEYAYEHLLGSKTGFVSQARQTLVSGAEKDGMKLVCVVFMEETPYQFADTVKLFEYGFNNFQKLQISDYETKYTIQNPDLFSTKNDLFGDSTPLLSMEEDACIVLPKDASFSDATSTLAYSTDSTSKEFATIKYFYQKVPIGTCNIIFTKSKPLSFDFESIDESVAEDSTNRESTDALEPIKTTESTSDSQTTQVIFINVKKIILGIIFVAVALSLIILLISFINSYNFTPRGQSSRRRKERMKANRIARKKARTAFKQQQKLQKQRRKAYRKRPKKTGSIHSK